MPKSRRLRKTKRMRGGNEEDMATLNRASEEAVTNEQPAVTNEQPAVTNEQPAVTNEQPTVTNEQPTVTNEQPTVTGEEVSTIVEQKELTKTIGEHVKNVTRKATNWLKGWFGIGQQMGGKRRTRKNKKISKKLKRYIKSAK